MQAALRIRPDHATAQFTAALCELSEGNLAAGWRAYELRWDMSGQHSRRAFPVPQWRGDSDLRDKTIVIHAEQGFGDTFQFCRYVPLLAERGARVIFEVQPKTARLMGSLKGVETLIRAGDPVPACDLHCPLLSLPLAFSTTLETIPRQVPYLSAPAGEIEEWTAAFPRSKGLRVGLAWSGRQQPNPYRTCPPEHLAPLLVGGGTFVSLQNQYSEADRAWLARHPELADVSRRLRDFAATAALISALDLVITIDTAVAHLAGALGKPVWVMLPFIGPDWRWFLNRSDSPWYPTARMFRQPHAHAWPEVISAVTAALGTYSPA
jgi:hypothetical protein